MNARTPNQNQVFFFVNSLLHSHRAQGIFFICAAIYGMIWSAEAVISISMIGLAVFGVFQGDFSTPSGLPKISIRSGIGDKIRKNRSWFWISIPFLLVLFTVPYSEDWSYILERLRIKLPFFVLPFAFILLPQLRKRDLKLIGTFFTIALAVAAVGVLWNYWNNYKAINAMIGQGKPIPTPSNHIRFSLAVAMGILTGGVLSFSQTAQSKKLERILYIALTLFLLVFLHILSVRSGLFALYGTVGVLILQYIYRSKRWIQGGALLALLIALPIIAMQFIPSFQKKYYYVRHDFYSYFRGEGQNYSDSGRIISLQAAWEIIKENPFLGVGAGDLKTEMKQQYEKRGQTNGAKMPHSQFFSITAGTGLLGLSLFLLGFFYPLFYRKNYRSYLFTALHILFFLSLFTENTFENNYGISLWLFALLIGMNYLGRKSNVSP